MALFTSKDLPIVSTIKAYFDQQMGQYLCQVTASWQMLTQGTPCYHWDIAFTTIITFTRIGYLLHHKNPGSYYYITTALIIGIQSAMMNPINGLHLTQPQPKLMAIFVLVHSLQNSLILALGFFHPNTTSLNLCHHFIIGFVFFLLLLLQWPWCWSIKIWIWISWWLRLQDETILLINASV